MENPLVAAVFETKALEPAAGDSAFWYTSGTFGPYYINTHFLAGGKERADKILRIIEEEEPENLPARLSAEFNDLYENYEFFKLVIDGLCEKARKIIAESDIEMISGGARRDYFFSLPVAEKLGLDHLAMAKDLNCVVWHKEGDEYKTVAVEENADVADKKPLLHIADLVTEASSYFRAWIPAAEKYGCKIESSLAVVDRASGGMEKLEKAGIKSHALLRAGKDFFQAALDKGYIDESQEKRALAFGGDTKKYMREFIADHPDFLEKSAAADAKTAEGVERFKSLGII